MKGIKTRNNFTLTEAEYFSKIRSALRKTFQFWKPAILALEKASRKSQSENKRIKKEFQCNHCKKWFKRADVQIDHIVECGSLRTYADITPFLQRLTLEDPNGFQVLCKCCHTVKTKESKECKLIS